MSFFAQHSHPGVTTAVPSTAYRDDRDRQRSGVLVPQQGYPDGYLETVNPNRRYDRLLGQLRRQNARSYSRGVHAGSRAQPEGYMWPEDFQPTNGLMALAAGVKQAPRLDLAPGYHRLTNDGKPMPRAAGSIYGMPEQADNFRQWRPPWQ